MESALNPKPGSVIREQAAEWLLARKQGLDPGRMQEFARWLATSPEHLAEYHAMERLGRDLPLAMSSVPPVDTLVEELRKPDKDDDNVVPFTGRARARDPVRFLRRKWAVAAVLAFVAVDVVVLWPMMKEYFARQPGAYIYSSETGELGKQLELDPDSSLQLDTRSAVDYSNYEASRVVEQLYGRVDYSVRHDPGRTPFIVDAGEVHVEDVGTRFSVYMMPDATRIFVLEGEVNVSVDGFVGATRVLAHQQLDVVPGQAPGKPVTIDGDLKPLSWSEEGEIRFDGPVRDALQEVNRYSARRIVIGSPGLGEREIHYTFRTGEVGDFLDFLADQLDVQRRDELNQIVLTRP